MEIILSICVTILISFILYNIKERKGGNEENITPTDDNENVQSESEESEGSTFDENVEATRKLCIETLQKLNCEVKIDPDDDRELSFDYQGGHFVIRAGDKFIRVQLLFWYEIDLNDLALVAKARKIINDINIEAPDTCIVYAINDEDQKMYIHSLGDTVFVSVIPNLEGLLRYYLESHFYKRNTFVKMINEKDD